MLDSKGPPIGKGLRGIEWSRDRCSYSDTAAVMSCSRRS